MALKHMQAKLEQQHAVLTKEVQDLKETLEVRYMAWGRRAGRSETYLMVLRRSMRQWT